MRYLTTAGLAAGVAAILAFGAQAKGAPPQLHTMTVLLPFGGTETIRYGGDVAPTVTWSDTATGKTFAAFDAPFVGLTDFDRIAATMNQQMAALDRQIAALQREAANAPSNTVANAATGAASGFCAETVEMTQTGNQPPHIVRHTYGACGAPTANMAAHPATAGQRA
ncbi:MAG: hypothetical protein JSS00_09170 [Proteobacteria bacterium]|nr:hypothetical protein [Pseudomonadota bacterium]